MQFQVIFESLAVDTPEERALLKERLIEKFKVPADKAERMVNTAPIVVKKGLTQEQAQKYKSALESIGARASIRLVVEESGAETAASPAAQQNTILNAPTVIEPGTRAEGRSTSPTEATKTANPITAEPDFPIFYQPGDDASQASLIDPYKTQATDALKDALKTNISPPITPPYPPVNPTVASAPIKPPAPPAKIIEMEAPTQMQPPLPPPTRAIPADYQPGEWWKTARVLNPPFDEGARSITPVTSGRVSEQQQGFSISHPMIEQITYDSIQALCAFQIGTGTAAKLYVDVFNTVSPRPIRLDASFINYKTFGIAPNDNQAEQVASFVKTLLDRNRDIVIDLATYRFLKDTTRVKTVPTDRDVEKYCGRMISEIETGLDATVNPNVISCEEANGLFDQPDPWAPALPPPPPPPPPGPGLAPGQFPPPGPYSTQPMRPPGTAQPMGPGPAGMQPPPPPRPPFGAPPQQFQPPYAPGQQPYPPTMPQPPMPQPMQPPPRPGTFAPPPMQQQPPFGMSMPKGPMPNQMPNVYQGPNQGYAMANQFPPPPGMMPNFANPNMEFYANKAREGAKSALLFSILGFFCCFPLAIVGLIKAQEALQIINSYNMESERGKAQAAKVIAIVALVFQAIGILMNFIF